MRAANRYAIFTSVAFMVWIILPLSYKLARNTTPNRVSSSEKRFLAKQPSLNIHTISAFPKAYEDYLNDQFPCRSKLITLHSLLFCYQLFHKSPVAVVAIGKSGCLFIADIEEEIYHGRFILPESDIQLITRCLHERALYYRQRNIRFYLAVVPMKCEIYPEALPNNWIRCPSGTITDTVIKRIAQDPLISVIDLKQPLLQAKKNELLYCKNDQHWNGHSAFYASNAILTVMGRTFPQLKPTLSTEIAFIPLPSPNTQAKQMGLAAYMKESVPYAYFKRTKAAQVAKAGYAPPADFEYAESYELAYSHPDATLPRIVIIRDSFFLMMQPLLTEHFHKTVAIFDAWQYKTNEAIIEAEKPDIVLLEIYEDMLTTKFVEFLKSPTGSRDRQLDTINH